MDKRTLNAVIELIANRIKELKALAEKETNQNLKFGYLIRVEEQQLTQIALQEALINQIKLDNQIKSN